MTKRFKVVTYDGWMRLVDLVVDINGYPIDPILRIATPPKISAPFTENANDVVAPIETRVFYFDSFSHVFKEDI